MLATSVLIFCLTGEDEIPENIRAFWQGKWEELLPPRTTATNLEMWKADEANEAAGFAMGPRGVPKDPKLLTKSTINNNEAAHFNGVQHSASFGPGGGAPGFGGA